MFASGLYSSSAQYTMKLARGVGEDKSDLWWTSLVTIASVAAGLWLLLFLSSKFASSKPTAGAPPFLRRRPRVPASVRPSESYARKSQAPKCEAPKSQAPESRSPESRSSEPPRSARTAQRRVIPLYDVTPGQSRYEYNIGDESGTRGSALARV